MKRIITAALLAASFNASAGIEVCDSIAGLAGTVMEARQKGGDMAAMVKIANGHKAVLAIVRDAFNTPRYSTPAIIEHTVSEFRNRWYSVCLESVS